MGTASAEVVVARPLEQVWEFVANVENFDRWLQGADATRWTSERTFTTAGAAGEIVERVPRRRQTVRAPTFAATLEVESAGAGTRIRCTLTARRLLLRWRLRRDLARLRSLLEVNGHPSSPV